MATNITKREAMTHYLPHNRNLLHIYEVALPKKKKKILKSTHAFKYQFTGNRTD